MKTTKEMEAYFLKLGHPQSDMHQLKMAIRECNYELKNNKTGERCKINNQKAFDTLGMEKFLSGISRAAFHATCSRDSEDSKYTVSFNLLKWWK